MKKVVFMLLLGFVAYCGAAYAYDDPGQGIKLDSITAGKAQGTAVKVYKLVRNSDTGANNSAISSGDVVVYDTTSADGITVVTTTTSGDAAMAGIAVTSIPTSNASTGTSASDDNGRRNWGYIQVYGPGTANLSAGGSNTAAAGQAFITSTDSGKITSVVDGDGLTAKNEINLKSGGVFLIAPVAADTSETVFINLM